MIDKLAVFMEFSGYSKDELEAYLSLKFGSMTRGGLTASILSSSGYQKAKSVIFDQTELNENQQIVFEQLCLIYDKQVYKSKMQAIYIFINEGMSEEFLMLDKKESDQVLAAFAEWGMKEVVE